MLLFDLPREDLIVILLNYCVGGLFHFAFQFNWPENHLSL